MQIGIIGKPASGKSSFFKAATLINVKITGIPFTTIKPNIGIGYVTIDCVCKEFGLDCNPRSGVCKNKKRFVPVKLIDVAGLVPGAHKGKGLGNQFLDDLRQASALIHIVDASGLTDEEGKPTSNHDPNFDIQFLEKEIDLWFADVIRRAVEKFQAKFPKATRADILQILSEQLSGLEIEKKHIQDTLEKYSINDIENFAKKLREVAKPILIAANKIDLKPAQENLKKLNAKNVIPVSAEAEIAMKKAEEKNLVEYISGDGFEIKASLDEKQKKALEFLKREVIDKFGSTGIQECLNKSVFELQNYIAVYPVADSNKLIDNEGNILPDVFLIPKGTTVKEFAFKIHTDIGKKFVAGIDARSKKKMAADHVLNHRDVVEIVTSK